MTFSDDASANICQKKKNAEDKQNEMMAEDMLAYNLSILRNE